MSRSSVRSLLALFAASPALAQVVTTIPVERADGSFVEQPVTVITIHGNREAEPYGPRDVSVLDNFSGAFANATLQLVGCTHLIDDFRFAPGPWAASSARIATSWSWALNVSHWDGPMSPAINVHFRAYNARTFASALGDSMILRDATLAADIVYIVPSDYFPSAGVYVFDNLPLGTTPGAEQMKFTGDSMLLEVACEDPSTPSKFAWYPSGGVTNALGNAGLYIPPGENATRPVQIFGLMMLNRPFGPGSATSNTYGRDMNADGNFTASVPIAGGGYTTPSEFRDTRTNAGRSLAVSIRGLIVPQSCPCRADFNASDGAPDNADVAAFFEAWLGGAPEADVNCSDGTPDTDDIVTFFTEWLAGGC